MAPPPRLAASVLVGAAIRRVQGEGGTAAVIAKSDPDVGTVLLLLSDRGRPTALVERLLDVGGYDWRPVGPDDAALWPDYLARRQARDPDLWLVELDHPAALPLLRSLG